MKFYLLASGSKGNCFLIESDDDVLVIDCGSSKHHLVTSFNSVNINRQKVVGVLLTHAHTDHISQLQLFKDKKIYAPFSIGDFAIEVIKPYTSFNIKGFTITPIPLSHDSEMTVGYIVENKTEKLVYITDTGYVKSSQYKHIEDATYYIVESNHDPEMLMETKRPHYVKQRILSSNGHLCNEDCAEMLDSIITENTKEIVLAHLSEEANTVELAEAVVRERINKSTIKVRAARQFAILEGGS